MLIRRYSWNLEIIEAGVGDDDGDDEFMGAVRMEKRRERKQR